MVKMDKDDPSAGSGPKSPAKRPIGSAHVDFHGQLMKVGAPKHHLTERHLKPNVPGKASVAAKSSPLKNFGGKKAAEY